jgi:hypothetical protein
MPVIYGAHLGQIDDRKNLFGLFRTNFQKNCWRVDSKRTSIPFDFLILNFIAHRMPKGITIGTFEPNMIIPKMFDLEMLKSTLLVRARASRPNNPGMCKQSSMSRFTPGTCRYELRGGRVPHVQGRSALRYF